jgi:hypothetical protein
MIMEKKTLHLFDSGIASENIKNCYKKPTVFTGFGPAINCIVCFDENGSSDAIRYIQRQLNLHENVDDSRRYFTLTGCIFTKLEYDNAAFLLSKLKRQYFPKSYHEIVLHTREIRKSQAPFNFPAAKYLHFQESLSRTLEMIDCRVISMTFDLKQYIIDGYQYDPYSVAFDFLLKEIYNLTSKFDRVALVFEARGKTEDYSLLNHIVRLMCHTGLKDVKKEELQKRIRGVFFNPKFPEDEKKNAYPGIEVADLFSYPIHRYFRDNKKCQDFLIVEKKIAHYPDYIAKGLRVFPSKWNGLNPFVSKK